MGLLFALGMRYYIALELGASSSIRDRCTWL
jgi:hypothetical protein